VVTPTVFGTGTTGNTHNCAAFRMVAHFITNHATSNSTESTQTSNTYDQRYKADNDRWGNNLFTRAGLTFHASKKDDLSLSGMLMKGKGKSKSFTPYEYTAVADGLTDYRLDRQPSPCLRRFQSAFYVVPG
jgi:hypothetical protein